MEPTLVQNAKHRAQWAVEFKRHGRTYRTLWTIYLGEAREWLSAVRQTGWLNPRNHLLAGLIALGLDQRTIGTKQERNQMTRDQALPYVAHALDDALSPRDVGSIPRTARLVGWQCGFEPLFVAVFSYLGDDIRLDDVEAEEIARDYLQERKWFADNNDPPDADYVI